MKVILLQDVKNLGKADQIVEVSDGYANNMLIRRKLAMEATPANLNTVKTRKNARAARAERERDEAKETAEVLKDKTFTLEIKCGEGGKLYGAVTAIDVAAVMAKDGFAVDRRGIAIPSPIKSLGSHKVYVKLHADVTVQVTIDIVAAQ